MKIYMCLNEYHLNNGFMKKSTCFLLIIFAFLIQGCIIDADSTRKLSGGYFYRNEGGDIKNILCENPNGGEIPSTIIDFSFDKKFIIAKQLPKIPQDPLYNKSYQYKDGYDKYYFWLIVIEKDLVLGPLNEKEFSIIRKEYNVPEKLTIK